MCACSWQEKKEKKNKKDKEEKKKAKEKGKKAKGKEKEKKVAEPLADLLRHVIAEVASGGGRGPVL